MNAFTYDYPVKKYFCEGAWTRPSTPSSRTWARP